MVEPTQKRLYRSRNDRMLAGVAGGMAEYFGLDPSLVRILWVVLSIVPGSIIGGLIVYVVLALIIPEAPPASQGTWSTTPPQAPPPSP